MDKPRWRNMKKTFWEPEGARKWDRFVYARYRNFKTSEKMHLQKSFTCKMERETWIREQNSLIRKFSSDEEYVQFWNTVLTLTS